MSKLENLKHKIISHEDAKRAVNRWHKMGKTVVFTNGCFDVLHYGHISCLFQAADFGQKLIVGLNSDASVKRLKGEGRPIHDEQTRSRVLAALTYVDAIVIFDEDTPLDLILNLQPDVLVKGGDYTPAQVVGASQVINWGGQVAIIPFEKGFSTTDILSKG